MKLLIRLLIAITLLLLFFVNNSFSQLPVSHPKLNQQAINDALNSADKNAVQGVVNNSNSKASANTSGAGQFVTNYSKLINIPALPQKNINSIQKMDTVFVGVVQHDTLVITGNYFYNSPILVFNDGVLIFKNANATIFGDLYIFQNGKVIADSSYLSFPQQYFYQRSIVFANNATGLFSNSTFDYSGFSHNLVAVDSTVVTFNNVHQNDWTTAGAYGHGQFNLNGINLAGEYILNDYSTMHFNNVNTLLLWHQFPDTALINFSFPNGDTLATYTFNNTIPGVSGVEYDATIDSSYNVWWGLMPTTGSDVTISNSKLRTVGMWFQHGDSVHVSGLVDNSSYTNFTAPLTDRNFTLINSTVQTYSLYEFDSSKVDITSCILGEVGTEGKSLVTSQSFLLDGSGGYFWATDTSFIVASNVSVTAPVRSEGNGIFVLGYSTVSNGTVTSLKHSLIIVVQSAIPQEPIPYDGALAWYININQNGTVYANNLIPISGSAWIAQGPLGSWMNFQKYSLFYKSASAGSWNAIVSDSAQEIHNSILGNWNTNGLPAGSYDLRLLTFNDLGDSIEAIKQITLLPSILGINNTNQQCAAVVESNPFNSTLKLKMSFDKPENIYVNLIDVNGQLVYNAPIKNYPMGTSEFSIPTASLITGNYILKIMNDNNSLLKSILVEKN